MNSPVRVFIVDDSATCRLRLRRLLAEDARLEVIGEAGDGVEALERIVACRPDIALIDVNMPRMDGLKLTRALIERQALPIVIVSDLPADEAPQCFEALRAGALDVLNKSELRPQTFARQVQALAGVRVVTRRALSRLGRPRPRVTLRPPDAVELICVGASSGGPPLILDLLRHLTAPRRPLPPILIAQHIAAGFTQAMARWLTLTSQLRVEEVTHEQPLEADRVYLAPDDHHLRLTPRRTLALDCAPGALCPSIDRLLTSVADSPLAPHAVAVLLSGMGRDGALGMRALRHAGGWTIAQDEAPFTVSGMPRAAVEAGGACEVLSPDAIGARLRALTA